MKKLIFFIALAATLKIQAQKFQPGFSGGLTVSNYNASSNDKDESSDPKAGFTLGLITRIAIRKHFIIQPEINWVQKGTKNDETGNGPAEKILLTTNNIEIPVNLLYVANKGFFIGGGPIVSFAVSGKLKHTAVGIETTDKIHFGNDGLMKGFDFGLNVLGGYKFKSSLFTSLTCNIGALNLSNGNTISGTETLTSNYFAFKIGYLFSFKKKNN